MWPTAAVSKQGDCVQVVVEQQAQDITALQSAAQVASSQSAEEGTETEQVLKVERRKAERLQDTKMHLQACSAIHVVEFVKQIEQSVLAVIDLAMSAAAL